MNVAPIPTYAKAVTAMRGIPAPIGAANEIQTLTILMKSGRTTAVRIEE